MNNDPIMFGGAANDQGRFDRTERDGPSPIVDYSASSHVYEKLRWIEKPYLAILKVTVVGFLPSSQ